MSLLPKRLCYDCPYKDIEDASGSRFNVWAKNYAQGKAAGRAEALAERRWIPVSERLPEDENPVLVYRPAYPSLPFAFDQWRMQCECPVHWSSATVETGFDWCEHEFDEVTHWMPLPDPPGGE